MDANNHVRGVMVNTIFPVIDKVIRLWTEGKWKCKQTNKNKNNFVTKAGFVTMSVFLMPEI